MLSTQVISTSAAHWLQPEEEAAWDAFVMQHPRGLIYHQTCWKRVLEQAFPHITGRFLVLRDNSTGAIRAGLPLYTVTSWLLGNRVVSVPFASFSDPLISSVAEFDQLLPRILDLCRLKSYRRLEVRFRKVEQPTVVAASSIYKHHFLRLNSDLDALFKNFSKSSIRQMIAKARKAGAFVTVAESGDSMKTCHDILAKTRSRLGLPPMPFAFFSAMWAHLAPRHFRVFLALYNGTAVGCHLVLTSGHYWISEYLGKTDDAVRGIQQLLYWEAIKAAHASGARVFSFGRTFPTNKGLLVHKRRWGTIEEELVYARVPLQAKTGIAENEEAKSYWTAHRVARLVTRIAPRFMLQRIGDFCYRHLG